MSNDFFLFPERDTSIDIDDGVKYINIYSRSRTKLGKMLSNFYQSPFVFDPYGKFESAEGFYFWLLSNQDSESEVLRNLSGAQAKKVGTKLRTRHPTNDDLEILKKMLVCKVVNNKEIQDELVASTLPFCHHYWYSTGKVECKGVDWLSSTYEMIRDILKKS